MNIIKRILLSGRILFIEYPHCAVRNKQTRIFQNPLIFQHQISGRGTADEGTGFRIKGGNPGLTVAAVEKPISPVITEMADHAPDLVTDAPLADKKAGDIGIHMPRVRKIIPQPNQRRFNISGQIPLKTDDVSPGKGQRAADKRVFKTVKMAVNRISIINGIIDLIRGGQIIIFGIILQKPREQGLRIYHKKHSRTFLD